MCYTHTYTHVDDDLFLIGFLDPAHLLVCIYHHSIEYASMDQGKYDYLIPTYFKHGHNGSPSSDLCVPVVATLG
jgi:hypothetical protein